MSDLGLFFGAEADQLKATIREQLVGAALIAVERGDDLTPGEIAWQMMTSVLEAKQSGGVPDLPASTLCDFAMLGIYALIESDPDTYHDLWSNDES